MHKRQSAAPEKEELPNARGGRDDAPLSRDRLGRRQTLPAPTFPILLALLGDQHLPASMPPPSARCSLSCNAPLLTQLLI